MKAVAADMQGFVQIVRHGINIGFRGHGRVEFGIKNRHGRGVGNKGLSHFNTLEVGRVVQRGQGRKIADRLFLGFAHQTGFLQNLAAHNHPVPHSGDFGKILDNAEFFVSQQGHYGVHARGMIRERLLLRMLYFVGSAGVKLVGERAHGIADTLYQTGAQGLTGGHIQHLILKRRAAIDNQNFHGAYPHIRVRIGSGAAGAAHR